MSHNKDNFNVSDLCSALNKEDRAGLVNVLKKGFFLGVEDVHFEAPKPVESEFFIPHCRISHLRSETYRRLVRILSPFCEKADVSLATEFDPQALRAASCSYLRQGTGEPSYQLAGEDFVRAETEDSAIENVTAVEDGLGSNSLEDGCFHDAEVKMDVIKHSPVVGISGYASDEREISWASSQDNHCVHEENKRHELEHIVDGNKMVVDDRNSNNTGTLDQKNGGIAQISAKKLLSGHQQVMANEDASRVQKLSGTISSLGGNRVGEDFEPKEDNQENRLSVAGKDMHQLPDNQRKDSESEGIVCEPDLERSHVHQLRDNQPKDSESEGIVCEPDLERSNVSSFDVMEVEDGELHSEKVYETDLSYLVKEFPGKAHEQSKNGEDIATSMVVDTSKVDHKIVSEDMQMDKCMFENGDMEEGEISGDSTYEISEDPIVLEKVDDIQIPEDSWNRNKLPSIQANGDAKKLVSFVYTAEFASYENKEEFRQNNSTLGACKYINIEMATNTNEDRNGLMLEERGYKIDSGTKKDAGFFTAYDDSNQVVHDQVSNGHASGRKETVSSEKETTMSNKKKRGPLSEGRKERKKVIKRKKRAEKNRKLGVKRLKLHPVSLPKPVVYCRHYLKGRCQEGDKCKFSHDTIPLTKSTPCSYFARHSCMKGDDCPFDHQLSKYPCSNFVSKGSCIRGNACMFSHKILPQEESTSTTNLKTESKPSLIPDNLDSQKKLNISRGLKKNLATVPNYVGTSCNKTPQGGALPKKTIGPPSAGINFLSFGVGTSCDKTPQGGALPKKTTGPPPAGINFLSFGTPPVYFSKTKPDHSSGEKNHNAVALNVCSVENSNEISRKIQPQTAPKRMDFLLFDKTSYKSSGEKLATPSSYNDCIKLAELVDSSLHVHVRPPSQFDTSVPSGNQIEAVAKAGHDSNELLKKVQTTTSKQTNFLFLQAPTGNYVPNELVSSSSNSKTVFDLSVQKKEIMQNKHGSSSAILSRLLGTPISSSQAFDSLDSSKYKGTPNSTQKALLSTLAFAAKYESLMNKNKSSGSPVVSHESSKEGENENISGSLKNNQAKVSKLLDFLLGVESKSNL